MYKIRRCIFRLSKNIMSGMQKQLPPKQPEAKMEQDEDTVFVVFHEESGACNRRPHKTELEQLAVLGYPMVDKDDYFLKVSSSDANPGRTYWTYQFAWVGWFDAVPLYNKEKMDKRLKKKKTDYIRYCKTQGLPLPEDLDVPKCKELEKMQNELEAIKNDNQALRHEFEELKKQMIILRSDVSRLKGEKVAPAAYKAPTKPTIFSK